MPTDTVYGLVAIASAKTQKKIIAIKQSLEHKKILLLVESIASAKRIACITARQERFLGRVWPGPVTAVLKSRKNISGFRWSKLAIRVPKNNTLAEIMKRVNRPLTATSANLSGKQTPRSYRTVQAHFAGVKHTPDAIFVSRGRKRSSPSTLIKWSGKHLCVIRQGAMNRSFIQKAWTQSAFKNVRDGGRT